MGFIKKIWEWFHRDYDEEYDVIEWNEIIYNRDDVRIHDKEQRREYIRSCLEQIGEATKEVESLQFEYNVVTSALKDMEEIEALPEEERQELNEAARRIEKLEEERAGYLKRTSHMSEDQYHKLESLSEEIQEGYTKLKEAEDYQVLIKSDMKKLDNEKEAYLFRKHELQRLMEDLRGMMIICITAVLLCIVLLLVMQLGFGMNTRVGYLLTAGAAALAIIIVFLRYNDAIRELKRVEKSINKIIMLHNTVKIRYINNTNLLEYLRVKYAVSGAKELDRLWQQYQEEKAERETFRQAEKELDESERNLLRILRRYQVKDTAVWLHQTKAILDKREMVEIRHDLIIRRQSLRRRMDYNKEVVAHNAQEEIKDLVEKYPQYASEILKLVAAYEKEFNG